MDFVLSEGERRTLDKIRKLHDEGQHERARKLAHTWLKQAYSHANAKTRRSIALRSVTWRPTWEDAD